MAKKKDKITKEEVLHEVIQEKKEELFNISSYGAIMKIGHRGISHLQKKYGEKKKSKTEWNKIFSDEKV